MLDIRRLPAKRRLPRQSHAQQQFLIARVGAHKVHPSTAVISSPEHALDVSTKRSAQLVALDDALTTLASVDARKARIVELRFFAGN